MRVKHKIKQKQLRRQVNSKFQYLYSVHLLKYCHFKLLLQLYFVFYCICLKGLVTLQIEINQQTIYYLKQGNITVHPKGNNLHLYLNKSIINIILHLYLWYFW